MQYSRMTRIGFSNKVYDMEELARGRIRELHEDGLNWAERNLGLRKNSRGYPDLSIPTTNSKAFIRDLLGDVVLSEHSVLGLMKKMKPPEKATNEV